MTTCTVKLGKDNWTQSPAIRIEFHFPPDVYGLSYHSVNDIRMKVHFLHGDKYPLSWFIGKTPLQLVRKIKQLNHAAGHGYNEMLDILERYLSGEVELERRYRK